MTSEQIISSYAAEAQDAQKRIDEAQAVLAAGGTHLKTGEVAVCVEANEINRREFALAEMRIHQQAATLGRRENRCATAYREWLRNNPGDFEGATSGPRQHGA